MMSWFSVCIAIAFLSIPLSMAVEQTFGGNKFVISCDKTLTIHKHLRCRSVPCCCQCFVVDDPKSCCCRTGSNQDSNDDSFERGRRFPRQITGQRHGLSCACPIPAPPTTTTPLPCCRGLQDFQVNALVAGSQCRPCDSPELPCCRGNTNVFASRIPGSQCRQCD
ncbi:hypothetical protein DdX_12739 [Ditylenchus destructor]|uniref:Uncharacterized protein n=1 Tax=Ditylenchus destructor TaxID=166010 RepID=A0AAD4MXR9_9BILA|nr:hypothetical protein DdX_12739 [Ditylenchus destructor]